ncbi:hypothetical protein Tco_0644783 [Tanacetum coccineum]
MGDGVISTTPERENDEFIKSSVDDLVPIPRESEVTSVYVDLEFDFLMENVDVAGLPRHLVKQIFNHLIKNPSLTKGMSNEPLGDDSKPKSYDVTFSNPLFDFNDDSTLCYDNPLFDEEFKDINEEIDLLLRDDLDILLTGYREIDFNPSRDIEELERLLADDPVPVPRVFNESLGNSDSMYHDSEGDILYFEQLLNEDTFSDVSPALLPTESSSLDLPLLDPKQICFRDVERFDPFFSLTQSDRNTRVMETLSLGFHHMPSPHPATYSPTEVMYCYYHPHLTTGDGFDPRTKRFPMILKTFVLVFNPPITRLNPFVEIPSAKSKVHIEVLSVLWDAPGSYRLGRSMSQKLKDHRT